MKTTETQLSILVGALEGSTTGGRNGWNTSWLEALAKRGLLVRTRTWTWESEWRLTDAGRVLAFAEYERRYGKPHRFARLEAFQVRALVHSSAVACPGKNVPGIVTTPDDTAVTCVRCRHALEA